MGHKKMVRAPEAMSKKKARYPRHMIYSSFFPRWWMACWSKMDLPTCKKANPHEKKLEYLTPRYCLPRCLDERMSWWKVFLMRRCLDERMAHRALVSAPEAMSKKKRAPPSPWSIQVFFQGGGRLVDARWTSQLVRRPTPLKKNLNTSPPGNVFQDVLMKGCLDEKSSWWEEVLMKGWATRRW